MEWEILNAFEQKDEVGNIYQQAGGVIPKACQKCKTVFDGKVVSTPITQKVPIYKCQDCEFEDASGDITLDHKIETEHKIKKESKDRLVGYEREVVGSKANIKTIKDDVLILCDDCNGSGS